MIRTLPKTLDLLRVRSPALLTLGVGRREVTGNFNKGAGHTNLWGAAVTQGSTGVTGHRLLSSGGSWRSKEPGDHSQDPQVKEWIKELHKDFSHQPAEGKGETKEELSVSMKEEKEKDVDAGRLEEREEKEAKSTTHKS